ncbi:acyl-CoA N-acyltransferase [Vararia minispora EC-137]|uniref:Acyl-CoA N-acyltransferase n=1 Tax=Vararia minispora EC-137 TaxID=1314806 RepID=A0ACB8QNA8_9AGAM|nr:acyl-CoA N-acyltransferase [Vararia minispora EC-137]
MSTQSLFQSARLTYRAFTSSDIDALYEAWNDPSVQDGMSPGAIKPVAENIKEKFKAWPDSMALFLAAADTKSGCFVGMVGLAWEMPRDAKLMMLVKRDEWAKGYGTEMVQWTVQHAFRFLDAHRVSLMVYASNPRAISIYKKAGFVQEGITRKVHFAHGRWIDAVCMGILDEEFFNRG